MKKLPILLLLSSLAFCSSSNDPFEQLNQMLEEQMRLLSSFNNLSEATRAPKEDAVVKSVDMKDADTEVQIALEFSGNPDGSIDASKKRLDGEFTVDGNTVNIAIERDAEYKKIDRDGSWVLSLNTEKKTESEKTNNAGSEEENPEVYYSMSSSYSSQAVPIEASIKSLKNVTVTQDGNTIILHLPKAESKRRTFQFATTKEESSVEKEEVTITRGCKDCVCDDSCSGCKKCKCKCKKCKCKCKCKKDKCCESSELTTECKDGMCPITACSTEVKVDPSCGCPIEASTECAVSDSTTSYISSEVSVVRECKKCDSNDDCGGCKKCKCKCKCKKDKCCESSELTTECKDGMCPITSCNTEVKVDPSCGCPIEASTECSTDDCSAACNVDPSCGCPVEASVAKKSDSDCKELG